MKSIKLKLFFGIILILNIFIIGIIIYGTIFKVYFEKEKLKEMETIILQIESTINTNYNEDLRKIVDELADKYNVQIDIKDEISERTIYATHEGKNNWVFGKNKFKNIKDMGTFNEIDRLILYDKSTGVNFLTAMKDVNNNLNRIIVKTPINIIDEAKSKSINLLIMIFSPIVFLIIILTLIFSNKFTKPIIEITKKTMKIKELDFSDDINVKGKDEVAVLSNSVNSLSYKIENTLNELNYKNLKLESMIKKEKENQNLRKEFVSSVSHELKSPITVILGYTQALSGGIVCSNNDKEYYIGVINDEAERMQVIVNDILDLYKLESNTFRLEIKEVNLADLVRKIVKKNSLQFKKKDINLICKFENALVIADEIRLEQAIQNYINNALSHVDKENIIEIIVLSSGIIKVFNSGKNIEDKYIEKIWDGFVRVDKVRNYKEKRVGLGLTIVREIVRLHKGQYGVKNKDRGVEFWIKIPLIQ
ncbi:sensor histidine kinase [Clostridium taeniosporum]|uniref:histidine kinase n=1 Tax=Clostridium taeniosporum TaxID=394958 RepID=A0A1D7XNC1_9CLOT|nr:HAMP domain-containing sensor histidine kinase [Clostridium taeniosporum]AOR24828.1 sensor histidine kinase [Clostridium taeniosporum]